MWTLRMSIYAVPKTSFKNNAVMSLATPVMGPVAFVRAVADRSRSVNSFQSSCRTTA